MLELCDLFAFEFIPNCHPTKFEEYDEEQLKTFVYRSLIDVDNRGTYEEVRDNVNAICDGLAKIGIKGITVCGTGSGSFGAHLSYYHLYPELIIPPARTERYETYKTRVPLPQRWLQSLNTALQVMLLRIIAEKDLNVGIDSMNPIETLCSAIAEPRMIYRIGAKAIGSFNSSLEGGVKNFLENNKMPGRKEEYRRQTSYNYLMQNIWNAMKKVEKDPTRKYASENWEAMRKDVLNKGPELLSTYLRLKRRKEWDTTRWAMRNVLGLN